MKIVLQDGIKDCGICSLLSIIKFYKGDISKEFLREITHTTKDGVTLYNLQEAAKTLGFDTVALTGDIKDIDINNLPCIAHVNINKNYKHFVVIYDIDLNKNKITIMDPAKGKRILTLAEYNLLTSTNYLFLKPNKKLPIIRKKNIIYRLIKSSLNNNKSIVFLITLLTFIYFILNILTSFHFKYLLEYSINYNISNNITTLSILILIIYLIRNINLSFRNILNSKWLTLLDIDTTTNTFKQILLLPYLYFKNRTTGEVIQRLKDLNVVRTYLSNLFCIISTDLICIIIFFIIMFRLNKELILIIILFNILTIFLLILINKRKKKILIKNYRSEDSINTYIIQSLSNVDTVKGNHLEKRLIDTFNLKYKTYIENAYNYNNLNIQIDLIKNSIDNIMYIFIYGLGSYFVINKSLTLSTLILYQTFINYFNTSFIRIIKLVEDYSSYKVSLDRVEELYMLNEEDFKNNYFYLPYILDGDIFFHKLNYKVGYKEIFNNLNLKIKKGEKILLSGESGCGKSTLVKMLMRYIEIPFGVLSIKGIDINHYHLENIRKNITYVTNNEYLYNDSIKNNITMYKEYTESEIEEVCDICLIKDIIKNQELGLEKQIEENGFNFSNGERQRIILARSIIKKSSIYIFDEALGGIDINKEKKILENIFKYLSDKTIIVISHRFNNKKLFDRVLKLENGKINEN